VPDGIHFIDLGPSVDDFVENFYQKKFASLKNWATFAPASEKGHQKSSLKRLKEVQQSTENETRALISLRSKLPGSD